MILETRSDMEWNLTQAELDVIDELDAEWQADLEHKSNVILSSIKGGFAFAFGPMFSVKDVNDVPLSQRREILEKVKASLSKCCAINSFDNNLRVLDYNNSLACDYRNFACMGSYDTVSYIFDDKDIDNSIVLAFKLDA